MHMRGFFFCPSAFGKTVHSRVMTDPATTDLEMINLEMINLEMTDLGLLRRNATTHADTDFAEVIRRPISIWCTPPRVSVTLDQLQRELERYRN